MCKPLMFLPVLLLAGCVDPEQALTDLASRTEYRATYRLRVENATFVSVEFLKNPGSDVEDYGTADWTWASESSLDWTSEEIRFVWDGSPPMILEMRVVAQGTWVSAETEIWVRGNLEAQDRFAHASGVSFITTASL